MADKIKYTDSFKKRLATKGYPLKGFYYQYSLSAFDENVTEGQIQTDSVIKSAYCAPTPTGVCLTMDYVEPEIFSKKEDEDGRYSSIHIWYKDLLKPEVKTKLDSYSLAASMTIPQVFEQDVYNMVYLDFDYECDLIFDNPPGIAHVLGSAMDKRKYSDADADSCFITLPSVRMVLRENMVAKKKRDVFQISTSGLIRI